MIQLKIRNHMDSSEDDEQTENYHNFFNFSISNEGNWLSCFFDQLSFFFLGGFIERETHLET